MATDASTLGPISQSSDFSDILKQEERFAETSSANVSSQLNGWYDRLMVQAGIEMSPSTIIYLCLFSALTFGGVAFVFRENLLASAVLGMMGYMLPIGIAMLLRSRRQSDMMKQMPAMLEELARAAKTGRSLEQCYQTVAEGASGALGHELRRGVRRMQMGVDMNAALGELPDRTGMVTMNILVTALSVHQQMGGDLVMVLERLSKTIRDRLLFLGRLRAATIASRATAILMLVLPPAILAFFIFRDPSYFDNLMASNWGRWATVAAFGLQIIGSFLIIVILRNSQRT